MMGKRLYIPSSGVLLLRLLRLHLPYLGECHEDVLGCSNDPRNGDRSRFHARAGPDLRSELPDLPAGLWEGR